MAWYSYLPKTKRSQYIFLCQRSKRFTVRKIFTTSFFIIYRVWLHFLAVLFLIKITLNSYMDLIRKPYGSLTSRLHLLLLLLLKSSGRENGSYLVNPPFWKSSSRRNRRRNYRRLKRFRLNLPYAQSLTAFPHATSPNNLSKPQFPEYFLYCMSYFPDFPTVQQGV